MVDPPTRIIEAPAFSAATAVWAAFVGLKSSGSINAARIVPFFEFSMMYFSTLPGAIKGSRPDFCEVVHECVVDVYVGAVDRIPELSPDVAVDVTTCDLIDEVL